MLTRIAVAGLVLALVSGAAVLLAPLGYRLGWFDVKLALLTITKWGVFAGIAAAALCLIGISAAPSRPLALFGLIIAVVVIALPISLSMKAKRLPMIHDIATDTADPPAFVALLEARKASPNGAEYDAATNAEAQRAAYPDITPYESSNSADRVFEAARALVLSRGWDLASAEAHRIEATDTTLFYGFKDDVVIRIQPTAEGSRLDMRSMSRVGLSDVGKNAERISAFVRDLEAALVE
jgi:uncharacterized protein (DUF1499 family)